jgi:hypothetical protein
MIAQLEAGTLLLCLYQFLIRGVINVFFVLSQSAFLIDAGFTGLPYVYAVMNLVYLLLQGVGRRHLGERSLTYLRWLPLGLALIWGIGFLLPVRNNMFVAALFLLLIMNFDLFFSQFFLHFLNDFFPLQVAKSRLPLITGFGSLSFIVSGFVMKLLLPVIGTRGLILLGLVALLIAQVLLEILRRRHPIWSRTEPAPETASTHAPASTPASAPASTLAPAPANTPAPTPAPGADTGWSGLARALMIVTALQMVGKYGLDYQYSRQITLRFPRQEDLAGFISVYSSVIDALVLLLQLGGAAELFRRIRLTTLMALLPLTVGVLCVPCAVSDGFGMVLVTQFLFTCLGKSLYNPAFGMTLGAMPSQRRMGAQSAIGMAASASALVASLGLVAIQNVCSPGLLFLGLAVIFGGMAAGMVRLSHEYDRELESAFAGDVLPGDAATLESLRFLRNPAQRSDVLVRLLDRFWLEHRGEDDWQQWVEQTALLPFPMAGPLFLDLLGKSPPPRLQALVVRAYVKSGGTETFPTLRNVLSDETQDSRVRSNILEALGELTEALALLPFMRTLLGHPHHRLSSTAAYALVRVSANADDLSLGLSHLYLMRICDAPQRRAAACVMLGKLGHGEFLPELAHSFGDPEELVQVQAVRAVGRIPVAAGARHLEAFLSRAPAAGVAAVAQDELMRLWRLTEDGLVRVLNSMTAGERQKVVPELLAGRREDVAVWLQRVLLTDDPDSRRQLYDIWQAVRDPLLLPVLQACVETAPGRPPAVVWAPLVQWVRDGFQDRPFWLLTIGRSLLAAAGDSVYDALLTSLTERVRKIAAGVGDPSIRDERKDSEVLREFLALSGSDPATALAAINRLHGGDPFAASRAQEFLQVGLRTPGARAALADLLAFADPRRNSKNGCSDLSGPRRVP